jgi:hypothetical protein
MTARASRRGGIEAAEAMVAAPDALVPDPVVAKEFSISLMTLFRWDADAALGFPAKITIRGRNYRSRRALEEFKEAAIRRAVRDRAKVA